MAILEDARGVLDQSPVCDPCLGRVFAARSHGLANAERGRALRVTCALAADEPFEAGAGEECWVCEGECSRVEAWAERAAEALSGIDFSTYQVGTKVPPLLAENDRLLREDAGLAPDAGESLNAELNREVGKRLGAHTGAEADMERADVVCLLDLATGEVSVRINPAFVYGRYRKLERGIPQTEWPCRECGGSGRRAGAPCDHCGGSGYMYDRSVEGYVSPPIREAMDGEEAVFHGAGREDVDARMLGTGRPFVVEVKEPRRRHPDAGELESRINDRGKGAVEVEGLRPCGHRMVERVKELSASKTYRAEVEFADPVDREAFSGALAGLSGATIEQDTPERVAHRRAAKTRTREAYAVDGELADDRHATVEVRGEGGLYIKELVHGDGGRTRPSLAGLLGVEAEVTALDVLAVEGEDEPFEDPDYFPGDG